MKNKGIVGRDIHKRDLPIVPEMCGIAILVGLTLSSFGGIILFPEKIDVFLSFLLPTLIAGLIGIVDDLKPLNAMIKPFLTLFACIPIIIIGKYNSSIVFPIIGSTRLTLVYPLLIPLVTAVTSNAVNMMDPFNGVMAGTTSILTITLLMSSIILERENAFILSGTLLAVLLAFFYYNKYPSKAFSGDVGSLSIGTAIGTIAIIGRLEVPSVVAFMPHIMNAFYGLSTIGRLYERREVSRLIEVLDDGRLMARSDPNAPLTLARFVLARGPLFEYEAVKLFYYVSAISGLLALFTAYLMVLTK